MGKSSSELPVHGDMENSAGQARKTSTRCNAKTEVYSRVVGYFRPVVQWNKGKQQEFKDRREFIVPGSGPAKGIDSVEEIPEYPPNESEGNMTNV